MNEKRRFFTVSQLMNYLGAGVISQQQLYRNIRAGVIPSKHIGKKILIPAAWVEEFCSDQTEDVKHGE